MPTTHIIHMSLFIDPLTSHSDAPEWGSIGVQHWDELG